MTSQSSSQNITFAENKNFNIALQRRYALDRVFLTLSVMATLVGIIALVLLMYDVFTDGLGAINLGFLQNFPSRRPERAGILSAIVGSIWLLITTALISFPIGVGAGIYLEEFATDNWFTRFVEINISNLAAVPSIIYGLLGLELFVRIAAPITAGRSILAGAMTLALLILPIIIVATRESLRAVSDSLRQGGFALGTTRWQVVRELVLPQAFPGILTGSILALSRAIGETAPLITIGALTFIAFLPPLSLEGFQTPFTALPIQIYNWVSRPQAEFHTLAAGGIIVLMFILLMMNALAVFLRNKFQKDRV
ncbi:phosphate ABC transporter permease PstA [Lyngbya confervoides]|uniref:Phosphate transport system permease protein PstA n=1 Tax=Lyngbya confervoides BDU141951 TaxID=1574623 RepID=A0ABD4T7V0_9CYAN|nr:phosphate ABC transporter permease PstA [Lyngbya confervoides]MCM1984372.1 phosphate ABC transporter permease PstA [Lyngbya confervoides BDU141951]